MKVRYLPVALAVVFSWHCTSFAEQSKDKPKFKEKQVVVYGTPEEFSEYPIVKYLPLSNLTILEVVKGSEEKEVKALRKKGRKAGKNYIAHTFGTVNDPFQSYQWNLSKVQAPLAWDLSTGENIYHR